MGKMTMDETSFDFDVPIPDNIEPGTKKELLEKVGRYLVESMLDKIAEGISPVEGEGKFKKLTKHYADEEKGGDKTANMDEHGDMLNALTFKVVGNKIRVGIFEKDQAIKSFAHNTGFRGHPTLEGKAPRRQFIPEKDQSLKSDILSGIGDITDEYISKD
jgi:hypothetical protein